MKWGIRCNTKKGKRPCSGRFYPKTKRTKSQVLFIEDYAVYILGLKKLSPTMRAFQRSKLLIQSSNAHH